MSAPIIIDDLETYVGQYGPHGAIQRLQFIASQADSDTLKVEAYRLCLDTIKRTSNAKLYTEVHGLLKEALDGGSTSPPPFDSVWVEATNKQASTLENIYEQDLHAAKSSQIKETVRGCFTQLINHCIEQGDYKAALKYVSFSREHCSNDPQAVFGMCMSFVKLSVLLRSYSDVQGYTSKANHNPFKDEHGQSKIHASSGLFYMRTGKYRDAALSFVQVRHSDLAQPARQETGLPSRQEMGPSFLDVMCPQDVALYGAICALASLDRNEVRTKLLEPSNPRECLDLVPAVRDLVLDFCSCRYAACLSALAKMNDALLLDVHLHGQVPELCQLIRSRVIVQYFSPFLSVSLHTMASAFGTDVNSMQAEVAKLVGKGQLDAKIDSHKKVLYARKANQRKQAYEHTMRVSQQFLDSTQALVLRMNMLKRRSW